MPVMIPHYVQLAAAHPQASRLHEPRYAERSRQLQREMVEVIDRGAWHDSPWAEPYTRDFVAHASAARSIVDVGAELGFYALLAARAMPGPSPLLLLEPDPVRSALLEELFIRDDRVVVRAIAAHESCATLALTKPRGGSATAACVEGDPFNVEAMPLDLLLGDATPDIIKIDVEGAEGCVFAGMERLLHRGSPRIYLETHPWMDEVRRGSRELIRSMCENDGYGMHRVHEGGRLERTDRVGGRMILHRDGGEVA